MEIFDAFGQRQTMSDEIYDVVEDRDDLIVYPAGTLVRLISGINGSTIPGYHPNPKYFTVCRIDAPRAEFVRVEKTNLRIYKGNQTERLK